MKTQILTFAVLLALSFVTIHPVLSQSGGTIKGTVTDANTDSPVPFANVYVKYGDNIIGTQSDIDGSFTIKPIPAGEYTLYAKFVGYGERQITNVQVYQDKITFVDNVDLTAGIDIPTIDVFAEKIIDPEETSMRTLDAKEMKNIPEKRDINKMVSLMSTDVQVSDDNSEIYFRGSRSGDALYIIDGMRMVNPQAMCPSVAIGSIQVYSGGVPAKYGDFTGGVIVIETQSYFEWLAAKESERLRNGGF